MHGLLVFWITVTVIQWPLPSAVGATFGATDSVTEIYVSFDRNNSVFSFRERPDDFTVAHARFDNAINRTGFSYLSITTVNDYTYQLNSSVQAYAAGLAEGFLTRELISLHFLNTIGSFCQNRTTSSCQKLETFLKQNLDWITDNVNANPDDSYWYQVRLFYEQIRGLQDGYQGTPAQITMDVDDFLGIYLLQISTDVYDISKALSDDGGDAEWPQYGHCSALIKLLPGNKEIKDILIAHDTWTSYKAMLRILKRYDTYLHENPIESDPVLGHTMTFSSYPGSITSIDDFYVLSSAMVTMETTNPLFNKNLYKKIQPKCVLESVRSMVANRLADHGDDWSQIFSQFNSGTYNNQWMIVDLKNYDQYFHEVLPGFVTVLEQIPGQIRYADLTDTLLSKGYWASYNLPYNDFKNDPLSRCNCTPPYSGENAISSRSDLNLPDGQYPFPELSFGLGGGIDMKVSYTL
ncbi:hypothetical protein C0Q70_06956 [Pomacea canaliculata]|uniref:Phospholipase B-like n=1 Tax=Pomacea canaliculata TaxID=400727 RepID=A0A2T7PDQ2_POMCA|nr:hypothetical protein C0Q70_06956 [Pomacea canaliculata]